MVIIYSPEKINESKLPKLAGVDYNISDDVGDMGFMLKRLAPNKTCFRVCIFSADGGIDDFMIDDKFREKVILFTDVEHLIRQLTNRDKLITLAEAPSYYAALRSGKSAETEEMGETSGGLKELEKAIEEAEGIDEPEEVREPEKIKEPAKGGKSDGKDVQKPAQTADTEGKIETPQADEGVNIPDDDDFAAEAIDESTDAFNAILDNMGASDEIMADATHLKLVSARQELNTLREEYDELKEEFARSQEVSKNRIKDIRAKSEDTLLKMKDEYDSTIKKVMEKMGSMNASALSKVEQYVKNPNIKIKNAPHDAMLSLAETVKSNVVVLASSSSESRVMLAQGIYNEINKGLDAVVVDFTHDMLLGKLCKVDVRGKNILQYDKDDFDIEAQEVVIGKTRIHTSRLYLDIALLGFNWEMFLMRLFETYPMSKIIFLLNTVEGFVDKYALSYLATVFQTYIYAKCSPISLASLINDLKFIDKSTLDVRLTGYIDVVKPLTDELAKKHKCVVVKDETNLFDGVQLSGFLPPKK